MSSDQIKTEHSMGIPWLASLPSFWAWLSGLALTSNPGRLRSRFSSPSVKPSSRDELGRSLGPGVCRRGLYPLPSLLAFLAVLWLLNGSIKCQVWRIVDH